MKKIVVTLLGLSALLGCNPNEPAANAKRPQERLIAASSSSYIPRPDPAGVVVDVDDLLSSPSAYLGQSVRFYMEKIDGYLTVANVDQDGYARIFDLDHRVAGDAFLIVNMRLSQTMQSAWKAAGLADSPFKLYTLTFSAIVTGEIFKIPGSASVDMGRYDIDITGFSVNAIHTDLPEGRSVALNDESLPHTQIPLPLPATLDRAGLQRLALLPSEYEGRDLVVELLIEKSDLEPQTDGTAMIVKSDVVIVFSPSQIKGILDGPAHLQNLSVKARFTGDRDAKGRPKLIASNVAW